MNLTLSQVALALGVPPANSGALVTGWSTDTRTITPGDFFFPLSGPNHNGHLHLAEAFEKGASGAVADRDVALPSGSAGPVFRVADTLQALQKLAAWARNEWAGDVIGVTGSAGKTSTKEIVARMVESRVTTSKTEGNLNNHIGLPLSILRLPPAARAAVLEFGMNHAGEIRDLAAIAKPRFAVITNVGYAHIENFESIDAVAAAKRELVESLPAEGIAVLNADDPRVAAMARAHIGKTITYGIDSDADVRATGYRLTETGVRFTVGQTPFESPVTGRHNILNILAGVAVGREYGASLLEMAEAAQTLPVLKMRGERILHNGVTIWDDTYNANPGATRAMIDVLRDTAATRRIAVLGEMRELGAWAGRLHADTGAYTAKSGIDLVVAVHGEARHLAEAAVSAGMPRENVHFVEDAETAGELLKQLARPGDAILFKGSRGIHMERALERYLA